MLDTSRNYDPICCLPLLYPVLIFLQPLHQLHTLILSQLFVFITSDRYHYSSLSSVSLQQHVCSSTYALYRSSTGDIPPSPPFGSRLTSLMSRPLHKGFMMLLLLLLLLFSSVVTTNDYNETGYI